MNEENLVFLMIAVVITGVVLVPFGRKFYKKFNISGDVEEPQNLGKTLKWILKSREVQKRLLFNLGMALFLQALSMVQVLGLDALSVSHFLRQRSRLQDFLEFLNIPPPQFSLFALGITPFISAALLLQLFSVFVPPLRTAMFGHSKERERLRVFTYALTFLIALFQSYSIGVSLASQSLLYNEGWGMILVTLSLTGGVVILLGLATLVEKYGLGSGIAWVCVSPSLGRFIFSLRDFEITQSTLEDWAGLILYLLIALVLMVGTFFLTRGGSFVSLMKTGSEKKVSVPFRISWVATQPMVWASSAILLPATLSMFWNSSPDPSLSLLFSGWLKVFLIALLTIGFTFLYSKIVFSSKHVAHLTESLGFRPSLSENISLKDFWNRALLKIFWKTSFFIIVIFVIEDIAINQFGIPPSLASALSGFQMLIGVGVVCDWFSQIEFLRKKDVSNEKDWKLCAIVGDEVEARLKAAFLEEKGIPVLTQPIRFTWGIPIRTMVDEYRLYTPSKNSEQVSFFNL